MDDLRWIEEESKVNQIRDFELMVEPMSSIHVHFVYINLNLEIEDKVTQVVDLDISGNLSKERMLYLIQTHKIYTPNTQYKFMSGLLYHVDILPAHLQSFVKEEVSAKHSVAKHSFLKEILVTDDIRIAPSLPLFHSIHGIYFFFKEALLKGSAGKTVKLNPILRIREGVKEKQTKRVRIQENPAANKSKKRRD
jgi:hypothetical protein